MNLSIKATPVWLKSTGKYAWNDTYITKNLYLLREIRAPYDTETKRYAQFDISTKEEMEQLLIKRDLETYFHLRTPHQRIPSNRTYLVPKRENEINMRILGAFCKADSFAQDFASLAPLFEATGARVDYACATACYEAASLQYLNSFYDLVEKKMHSGIFCLCMIMK